MKKTILLVLLGLTFASPPLRPAALASGPAVEWLSFDEAQKVEAKNQPKKFFLYFYTSWCGYCRKLDQSTFLDKEVANYINSNFIPVRINSEKLPKVAARYRVEGVPDLRFLTAKGEEIARWPGYLPPDKLLPLLKYIQSDSYLRMGFKEFLSQK